MNRELNKVIIKELLLSKEVFLVAHNNIDLDAFASMAGFSLLAKKYKSRVYIIINDKEIEPATKLAIESMNSKLNIIKLKDVDNLITDRSILFVLDTNKTSRICAKDMLDKFKKVIVIDHHTKNPDTIKDAYVYINEKASSTSEIVTILLDRFRVKVPKNFATILLGGIVLDTNNFMYKMTRESFLCCYYLSTKGADIAEAQLYFKQDIKEYINRAKIIASTEIKGEIAIATGKQGRLYKQQDIAKTADILLEFKGIKASFALGYLDESKVGISARSVSKLDVGKLMEKFGGGGNKTEAAAVIENKSLKKVYEELLEQID